MVTSPVVCGLTFRSLENCFLALAFWFKKRVKVLTVETESTQLQITVLVTCQSHGSQGPKTHHLALSPISEEITITYCNEEDLKLVIGTLKLAEHVY